MKSKSIVALAAGIIGLAASANAATVFSFYQMAPSTPNVATMSLAEGSLWNIGQLAAPGPNTFNIAYAFFTPTVSGAYSVGIASASYDTVLLMYEGQSSFPSGNPRLGAIALNDDGNVLEFNGLPFTNTSVYAQWNSLIQDINLTGGTTYLIGATSYNAGTTIPLPLEFFVYGEPVSVTTTSAPVPEPSSLGLLALGAGGLLARRRRNRAA